MTFGRLKKAQSYRDSLDEPYEFDQIVYVDTKYGRIPQIKTVKVDEADDETKEKAEQDLALAQARYDDALRNWSRIAEGPDNADIIAAQARIDAAHATLSLARLTAPFEGTITEVNTMPGDQVAMGTPAFRIDDFSNLLVDVDLSEVDINNVSLDQAVSLSFDAILEKEYHGKVVEVGRIGTDVQGVVNFNVTIEITDADELVRPGMTAAVNIVVKEIADAILIPNRSVRVVDGERVVYLLKNGFPEMVEVRLGASDEGMSVLVSSNIEAGADIILNPPDQPLMGSGPAADHPRPGN